MASQDALFQQVLVPSCIERKMDVLVTASRMAVASVSLVTPGMALHWRVDIKQRQNAAD